MSIFITSGGHFAWRSGTICEIVVESVFENNPGPGIKKLKKKNKTKKKTFFHTQLS